MKGSSMIFVVATIIVPSIAIPSRQVSASIADSNVHVNQHHSICESPACIHEASFILKNMDSSIEPCENFYQFACGKFVEETVIPDFQSEIDIFKILNDKLQEQLRLRIADEIKEDHVHLMQTVKSYYQMCMDTDKIEKNSEIELRKILKSLGGCPILEGSSWDEANFDWKKTVYKANNMGYFINRLIGVYPSVDPDNSTRLIVYITPGLTELPREYLMNGTDNHMIKVHLKYMTNVFELLGADRRNVQKELNEIIDFGMELAKISLSKEEQRNGFNHNKRMTLHQLETSYKGLLWTEYLNEILAPYAHLHKSEEVIVVDTSFLENLPQLLAKTPMRIIANYLCFSIVSQSINYMGKDFLSIKSEFMKEMGVAEEQLPRWETCLQLVTRHFPVALGKLYVKYYFDDNAKIGATYLTQNLRNSLHHLIEKADWMDEKTKAAALEKLHFMKAYVGYPDELDNDEMINTFYEDVMLDFGNFLRSEMNLKKFEKQVIYSYFRQPSDSLRWLGRCSVAAVNAGYSTSNSILIPAGILQGHFYNKDRPNYVNYGAIGSVIGHEMSHAFDHEGSLYDKNGNLLNWWKNETKKEYLDKAKCIIEQYGNYTVKEANTTINGIETQGENIADNVGLKAAYLAYSEWVKRNEKEPQLPGLNYTPQQMFWISYANNLCKKIRPEQLKNAITNEHAYSEFRVIGPLSNSNQFSKDFKCPLGSPMNPIKKCSIW